jgi:hypothetical protein
MELCRGVIAGLAGTLVVQLLAGRTDTEKVYAPQRVVLQLSTRYPRRRLSTRDAGRVGTALRWLYGLSWGAGFGAAQERLGVPYLLSGLGLAATVFGFEMVFLPGIGATPALRDWGRRQVIADGVQALLFGLATTSTLALLR